MAGLVTVYLVTMLVAWCVDGIQNVGMGDARVPVLVVLAVAPFLAFGVTYGVALRTWTHRAGRAFVALLVTAPVAVVALLIRAATAGGM